MLNERLALDCQREFQIGVGVDRGPGTPDSSIVLGSRADMIKKVKGGYKVLSEKTGKNLGGPYKALEEAKKRLRQVEFFKHQRG